MKYLNCLIPFTLMMIQFLFAQVEDNYGVCGTPSMSSEEIIRIKTAMDEWLPTRSRNEAIHIYVAWHVITSSNGTGNYSDQSIYDCMALLNANYLEHNFFFTRYH